MRKLQCCYRMCFWIISMVTYSSDASHGRGMVVIGACSGRAGRWVPGRITFLGQTAVCSGTYPSRTPDTTWTIIWSWCASKALPRGSIIATSGGACGSPYARPICQQGKTQYLRRFNGRSPIQPIPRGRYLYEYPRRPGVSLATGLSSTETQHYIRHTSGTWVGRYRYSSMGIDSDG